MIEKIPFAEIENSAPPKDRENVRVLMRVLSSMNREYHDYKGNPRATLDDHAVYEKLDEAQTADVKKRLRFTNLTAAEMAAQGFDLPDFDGGMTSVIEVAFPHRQMIFFVARDFYLDLNEPGKIYVYRA